MKHLHNKNSFGILPKLGIFSASLFVTASAIYLYSPVLGSNAADMAAVDVNVEVNQIISLSLDTNALNFSLTPTSSGVFDSKPIVATVDTNSTGGYELYFSSIDDQTSMTSLTSESTITSTFANTVTSTTMAANTWGYSLDNTDFSKIPTLTNHVALKNLDHLPTTAEKTTTTNIGVKIDSTLASGTYNKKVLFSAIAHATPNIPTMQTFDKTSLVNTGNSVTLEDERDGKMYTVKKLADGNVWMTQNLALGGNNAITLTSVDSDVSSDYVLPVKIGTLASSNFASQDVSEVYIDSTYGGYYSFYAATAGTGGTSLSTDGDNAPSSICPKGWKLPTTTEFQVLYNNYNSVEALQGVPGLVLAGNIFNNTPLDECQGDFGGYWTSTVVNANDAYYLYIDDWPYVDPANVDYKYGGYSVRCIAR